LNNYIKHKLNCTDKYSKSICINCRINVHEIFMSMPIDAMQYYNFYDFYNCRSLKDCIEFVEMNATILCLTEKEFIIKSILE
jgi:hypothetical protein